MNDTVVMGQNGSHSCRRGDAGCISEMDAHTYLEEWRELGIAHEVAPGEWALSPAGRAMFEGWAVGIELEDGQGEAA